MSPAVPLDVEFTPEGPGRRVFVPQDGAWAAGAWAAEVRAAEIREALGLGGGGRDAGGHLYGGTRVRDTGRGRGRRRACERAGERRNRT